MPQAAATVTIPGVELVKAGTWHPGTHPAGLTITTAQLADIVAASTDVTVDEAPVKIGHRGQLAELGDGAPAFGWARNLRLNDAGDTVIGDLVDVPAKLAAIIPAAYRKRSSELRFDVRTIGGRVYKAVLSGLALLGASAPAVKGLADITDLYALGAGDTTDPDTELELEAGTAELAELADALGVTIPPAADGTRQNDGIPPTGPEADPKLPQETETMDDATLRSILKLEDDADLEAELTKLAAAAASAPPAGDGTPPAPPAGEGEPPAPAAESERELVGSAALSAATLEELAKAGVTVLPAAVVDELRSNAELGKTAAAQLAAADLDATIDDAIRAGKVAPAEAEHYRKVLEADLETGKALLAGLAPRFAVVELGDAAALELDPAEADKALESFLSSLPGLG